DVGFWGASSDRRRRRSRPERRRPAGMTGSGALPDVATARAVVADADALAALLAALAAASAAAREQVRAAFGDSREEKVLARLDTVDLASLRDVTRERLRLGALADAGVRTVGEVARLGRDGLEKVPGIGPQTATHLLAAAEQVARAVRESLRFRIDLRSEEHTSELQSREKLVCR